MKKIFIYTLTTALIWGVAGCKKPSDFGTTNADPTAIQAAVPSAILSNAELSVSAYAGGLSFSETLYGAQYAQYYTETQYPAVSLYNLPQLSFAGEYSGTLYDLQTIINGGSSKNMSNIASIMQQYIFWHITDAWGDVPYSQALKGISVISPAYDKQQDIYTGMLTALTTAVSSFDSSPITGDLIYAGNVASWKRLANSLRLLISLQLSKKYPGATDVAATAFKAALADANGTITANAQNFQLTYPGGTYKDPLYSQYDGRFDYAESTTVTSLTAALGDNRTTVFGGAANDPAVTTGGTVSSSVGIPPGTSRNAALAFENANPNWAYILRADKRTQTSTQFIITAAEVLLARAEAISLGWATGDTYATVYAPGIVQSFEQWGLTDPTNAYLTQTGVDVTTPATAYANIIKQRYLASYPDGFMAWDIYRKTSTTRDGGTTGTAFANNPLGIKQGVTSVGLIPSRFTYATTEYSTNGTSVNAAVLRLTGGDKQDSRVWWDQ
jgi:hypothetical protein